MEDFLLDDLVKEHVLGFRWYKRTGGYYARTVGVSEGLWDKYLLLHRVVWELFNGSIPRGMQIDHINGCRTDNRLCNLRLVTPRQNQQNRKVHREGKLPGTGRVEAKKGERWIATTTILGKRKHLGTFDTEKEAHEAYLKAIQPL